MVVATRVSVLFRLAMGVPVLVLTLGAVASAKPAPSAIQRRFAKDKKKLDALLQRSNEELPKIEKVKALERFQRRYAPFRGKLDREFGQYAFLFEVLGSCTGEEAKELELLELTFQRHLLLSVWTFRHHSRRRQKAVEALACIEVGGFLCKKPGRYTLLSTTTNEDCAIAASCRQVAVYQAFADAVRHAMLPTGLTEEQIAIYRAELDAVALGPEERSREIHEALRKKYRDRTIPCTETGAPNLKSAPSSARR